MPASTVQDILTELIPRMEEARARTQGIAVVIGAGCSMQYGLPSFYELLLSIYHEHYRRFRDLGPRPDFETLRGILNDSLRRGGPNELRRKLSPHLTRVKGADCRAYRLLARLAKKGFIHTVVNMNFDILLEQALEAEGVEHGVSQSFQRRRQNIMVYKPHGSLRAKGGKPVLSIEHSRMFEDPQESKAAAALLSKNHVLILGYSGGDAKILGALRSARKNVLDEYKLFVFNVDGPGVDLTLAQERRNSKDLNLIGEDASFASFMESIYGCFDQTVGFSIQNDRTLRIEDYLTRTERSALEACCRLALKIRSTINVADFSSFRLEEHADDLFQRIIELSRACEIPLTEAEKYLARSASCFHDLGFFWARSGHNRASNPGFKLLHEHGQQTHDLLRDFLHAEAERRQIVPSSYDPESRELMLRLIQDLCRLHTKFQIDENLALIRIFILDVPVPIRFDLVHALFVLAEETLSSYPWIPNADLAVLGTEEILSVIEDPVTDLYWRRQDTDLSFQVETGKLIASSNLSPPLLARWLLQRAEAAMKNLNDVARRHQGRTIHLETTSPAAEESELEAVSAALTEALERNLDGLPPGRLGRLPSLLDLLAIYVLPISASEGEPVEPRVPLSSEVVARTIKEIEDRPADASSTTLLGLYFMIKPKPRSAMEQCFCQSFQEILYPAWRFLAQHWSLGVYSLSFAHTVLTLGSSRFRTEVALGIRSLIRDKVFPGKLVSDSFYGHSGCMQCTGLLLHIFSSIQQRFTMQEIEKLVPRLDVYMKGLLQFVLSEELREEDWFGLYEERTRGSRRVQSISYLAWAIQGLIHAVRIDQEIRQEKPEGWLNPLCSNVDPETLRRLIRSKWSDLCKLPKEKVGSIVSEGGFSHGLHNVSLCWLEMRTFEPQSALSLPNWFLWAYKHAISGDRDEDRRFTLIPALIVRSEIVDTLECRELLVDTVAACLESPLWITQGENRGSWGYNASKTQELTSALVAFWLYAFEHRDLFEPIFSKREAPLVRN